MSKISRADAQNKFYIYYGNRYAGVDGVSIWKLSGWDLVDNNDGYSDLYFIMIDESNGRTKKIQFNEFVNDYTDIGKDPNPPKQMINNKTSEHDDYSKRLDLMTEEEEAEYNKLHQNHNSETSPPELKSSNPIHILLDGRKNKPKIKIPINYEMEFIDDLFYKLIEQSYSDSLDSIVDYFIDSVNMESVIQTFKDSIEMYIIDKLASDDSIVLRKKKDVDDKHKEYDGIKINTGTNNNTLTIVSKQKK